MNVNSELDSVIKNLDYYGISYSTATYEDLKSLQYILIIAEKIITSREEMKYCYDFIRSDNKYTRCMKSHIRKYEMSLFNESNIRKMKSLARRNDDSTTKDKMNTMMEKIITLLYSNTIMQCLYDPTLLKVAIIHMKNTKLYNIDKIIGELTEDEIDNQERGPYTNIEDNILLGFESNYKRIEFGDGEDILQDSLFTLERLKVKNIEAFIKKCNILDAIGELDYKIQIVMNYLCTALYVTIKTLEAMKGRTTGKGLMSLTSRHYKTMLNIVDKHGFNNSKMEAYLNKTKKAFDISNIKELRSTYTYITPEVLSDEKLITMDKIDLASLNYRLKLGEKA